MVIATNNKGKVEEFKKLFQNKKIYSLKDKNIDIEIEENQDTFIENAKKKAMEIYEIVKEETIADDSGLCVKCLNDFPGVMTHRFLGEEATDRMRNEYLIKETNKYEDRSAQMVCAIVYYNGEELIVSEGKLDGYISKDCRGENGFGFDEIFELPNGLTLAELTKEEKNVISARAVALKNLKKQIAKM